MTADFGNFVAKNDEKRKTKDEMNPVYVTRNVCKMDHRWRATSIQKKLVR